MPSHALTGEQTKKVQPGHGKVGAVRVACDVRPSVKDRLIALASRKGTWVTDELREAVEKHLQEAGL